MLVIRDVSETTEGTWFKFKLRGEEVELKVRPFSSDIYEKIRNKYKKSVKQIDPSSKAMINADMFDEDAITEDFINYLLEDFKGFGDETGKILDVSLKNKKKVINIPTLEDYETSISDFIFTKAKELSAMSESEIEGFEKNS